MPEQHLDLDSLADVLAADEAANDAHLRSCATCRARLAELHEALAPVAASLATMPLPDAPADLDDRIHSSLDRLRTKAGRPEAARKNRRVAPATPRRLAWVPLAGGLAAAAALVFGIVMVSGDNTSSDSSTDASAPSGTHTNNTGLGYGRDGKLLTAELPALLNGTAIGLPTPAAEKALSQGTTTPQGPRVPGATAGAATDSAADPLGRLRTTDGLASCLTALSEGSQAQLPLALDYAQFEKQPALVVVLPSSKASKVDVFVVGAGCAQQDAQVLYFTRLTAP